MGTMPKFKCKKKHHVIPCRYFEQFDCILIVVAIINGFNHVCMILHTKFFKTSDCLKPFTIGTRIIMEYDCSD